MVSPAPLKRIFTSVSVFILVLGTTLSQEAKPYFDGDRIIVEASINGTLVKLAFDTGSDFTVLFSSTAKRLQLKTGAKRTLNVASIPVEFRQTNPLAIKMFGIETEARLSIFPVDHPPQLDGAFGWRDARAAVLVIDGIERRFDSQARPPEGKAWQRWELDAASRQLFFTVTDQGKPLGRVFVDTGAVNGLRVSPGLWRKWRSANPDAGDLPGALQLPGRKTVGP